MKSALHQNPGAAERYRLVDSLSNLIERVHIGLGVAGPSIKGAESAHHIADVGVVDIPVDYVCDNARRVPFLSNLVGGKADAYEIMRFEKRCAIIGAQAFAR
jgi:hypothetical protein